MTDHQFRTGAVLQRLVSDRRARPENVEPDQALELAKRILRLRRMRDARWESIRFADPAWDILLGLFVAHHQAKVVARSDATTMATVPPTTARRALQKLITANLVNACPDPGDRRRQFLRLHATLVRDLSAMLNNMAQWPHLDESGRDEVTGA